MAELDCMLATPDGLVFEGKARSVVVPALDGELGILARHAPLISALGYGELRIEEVSGTKGRYFLAGGFVQVLRDRVAVLATEVESVASLGREEARQRVEAVLSRRPPAGAPLEELEAHRHELLKARARQKLAG